MPSSRPGDVCAHTHLYSGLAPLGMPAPAPPPESFVQILERVWWRLDRALDEETLRAAARLYVAEAALAGTTTVIDHHESPNFIEGSLSILADAFEEIGLRGLVCYGATERNGGREEAQRGLAECRRFAESLASPGGRRATLLRAAVALHASFTVSDETVREAGALCGELHLPMHVHVAEDGADVEDARRRGYAGPLERLQQLGALPAGSIVAHGVHLSPAQVRAGAQAGLWFVHNPRSNKGNRVGYSASLVAAEARVALGTDGYPARMDEEARVLEAEARAHGQDPAVVAGRRARGADLAASLWGDGVREDLVTRGDDGAVQDVVVAGRRIVQDGRLLTADLEGIRAQAAAQAARLWERMEIL